MILPSVLDQPTEVYVDVRPRLKSGDLLLCSGTAPFSRLIQGATGSPWSHVAVLLRMASIDRILVLESVESIGVRSVSLRSYVEDYNGSGRGYPGRLLIARHRDFPITADIKCLSRFAIDRLGRRYDNQEILAIAQRVVAAKLGLSEPEARRDDVYICSEFAHECYRAMEIEIPYNRLGYIAPADFAAANAVEVVASVQRVETR